MYSSTDTIAMTEEKRAPGEERASIDAAPEKVRIILANLPEDAEVLVDGVVNSGPKITRPRTAEEVGIEVRLKGYRPFYKRASLSRDATIDVNLERISSKRPSPKRRASKSGALTQPRTEAAQETHESLEPVRSFGEQP